MFVYDIKDILTVSIIVLVIIYYILKFIIEMVIEIVKKTGKKNCYDCKYYKLYDVQDGGISRRKCVKKNRIDGWCKFTDYEHYEKCKYFKENR